MLKSKQKTKDVCERVVIIWCDVSNGVINVLTACCLFLNNLIKASLPTKTRKVVKAIVSFESIYFLELMFDINRIKRYNFLKLVYNCFVNITNQNVRGVNGDISRGIQ